MVRRRLVVAVLSYFVACAGKVTPFRIICGRFLEGGRVSVAGPHGENIIFSYQYCDIFPSVFTFAWYFIIEDIFDVVIFSVIGFVSGVSECWYE